MSTPARPRIITRRAWGAVPPRSVTRLHRTRVKGVAVHYSAGSTPERHRDCAGVVRSFQRMHMAPGGLGVPAGGVDIAYSWVLCPHGYTFRGRGIDVRQAANGTTAANAAFYSACVMGRDRAGVRDVTPEARRELLALLLWLDSLVPGRMRVPPHSAFTSTECPGDELRALVALAGWLP